MAYRRTQGNFSGGELGEEVYARADIEEYGIGLKTAYNVIIRKQGGLVGLAGTEHVCTVPDSNYAHRLTPFEFNTEQAYINVWGNEEMSVIMDGAPVLEDSQDVEGVTRANPGVVHITAHGWDAGDIVYASGLGGMTQLNAHYFILVAGDADHFSLKTLYGVAVNTTAYTAWTSGGVFARVHRIATPYTSNADPNNTAAQVFYMDTEASNDEGFVAHLDVAPQMLTRAGHADWSIGDQVFAATIAAPTGTAAVATVGTGIISYNYVVTAINDITGEESVASVADACTNDLSADPTYKNTITCDAVADATRYSFYKEENGLFGFIGGTVAPPSGGPSFDDGPGGSAGGEITPDLSVTPPLNTNPFPSSGNFPASVTFFEARLIYAQTRNNPGAFWTSQPTRNSNFNRSVPARSDDTVVGRLLPGVNAIQGMAGMGDALFFATSKCEFTLAGGGVVGYLTPASAVPHSWSRRGSDRLKPLVVGETTLFVQKQGRAIYAFGPSPTNPGKYASVELTALAPHLLEGMFIVDWCYQQDPHGIVWIVRSDGKLLALTYLPEFKIFAFTRAALAASAAGAAVAESCACISGPDEDEVYFEVKRTINSQTRRHVERLKSLSWGTDVKDFWGLHGAILFDGAATNTFDGFDHLEGETVAALARGFLVTGLTVTNGRVTLPTSQFPAGATPVLIGLLPDDPMFEPLPVAQPEQSGAPQGKRKRVMGAVLKLRRSCGVYAGSTADTVRPLKLRRASVSAGTATPPFTGDFAVAFDPKYSKDGTFVVRGTAGLPFSVTAIYPDLEESHAKIKPTDLP